jgi:predicted O-methyltransferase YrrM
MARVQARPLRLPFMLAPIQRRSPLLLRRRLKELGALDAGALIRELDDDRIHAKTAAAVAEYCRLAPQFAPGPGSVDPSEGALLYGLVRALRPATVVETGTASGISTTYLLAALRRNGAGRLISIDLPFEAGIGLEVRPIIPGTAIDLLDSSPVPEGKEPGWAVPDELRARWELRLGDARTLLPEALAEVGEVDIFFHDSLHSREHMLFEFETAWPRLATGGVIVADDIFQREHDAVPAFARDVDRPFSTFGNLGLIRK